MAPKRQKVWKWRGYTITVSDDPLKKYKALVDGKWVHFGDRRYQHYKDKIGFWRRLDHGDKDRRRRYIARHSAGGHTDIPGTAAWFALNVLW